MTLMQWILSIGLALAVSISARAYDGEDPNLTMKDRAATEAQGNEYTRPPSASQAQQPCPCDMSGAAMHEQTAATSGGHSGTGGGNSTGGTD